MPPETLAQLADSRLGGSVPSDRADPPCRVGAYFGCVFRAALWTLRQPRYAALATFMLIVATICTIAGTWQISRFEQSVRDNHALDGNAHAAAVPLTTALVPLTGHGPIPSRDAIRFRTVTASGTYLAGAQEFVRDQSLNGTAGYYVLNPLRTPAGVLLVVRGFLAATAQGSPPATITAPPLGPVQITGRLQTVDTKTDAAAELGNHEIASINPSDQADRLGAGVYDTYLTLNADQPGTSGLSVLPDPDLSNPAGGVVEPQHFAYILQWYLFALLALAAPFAMSRFEVRDARRRFLGIDPAQEEFGSVASGEHDPRLQLGDSRPAHDTVARRASGALVRPVQPTPRQWQRAAQLAERYGRSLGIGHVADQAAPAGHGSDVPAAERSPYLPDRVPNSATRPHPSYDSHHGTYNDYLWQLALADGAAPTVSVPPTTEDVPPSTGEPD